MKAPPKVGDRVVYHVGEERRRKYPLYQWHLSDGAEGVVVAVYHFSDERRKTAEVHFQNGETMYVDVALLEPAP